MKTQITFDPTYALTGSNKFFGFGSTMTCPAKLGRPGVGEIHPMWSVL
jgi:hypothetical protein